MLEEEEKGRRDDTDGVQESVRRVSRYCERERTRRTASVGARRRDEVGWERRTWTK